MPLYDYVCPVCARSVEVVLSLAELDTEVFCPDCRNLAKRQMSAPFIQMDYPGYVCPVSGKYVEGKKAHKANLEKHGCRILEKGEFESKERARQTEEKEFDKRLERTVGETIHSFSSEKQRKLTTELEHGASAAVVRQ